MYRMNQGVVALSSILMTAMSVFAQQKPASPGGSFATSILPMMLIMFAIIYFLMIRPEQKKQKQRQELLKAIKKGDKVVTIGGLYGTVGSVKDTTVMVKIAENTVVEFTKAAISTVISGDGTEKVENKEEKKK